MFFLAKLKKLHNLTKLQESLGTKKSPD